MHGREGGRKKRRVWPDLLLPPGVTVCCHSQQCRELVGEGVTKPIIFTYLPLPASRHVILNGHCDPWAEFEPTENMVSQMKLSQATACVQQAFQPLSYLTHKGHSKF